jgi:hypothetical protein
MANPKRPRDVNQRANLIARISTGELKDNNPDEGKNLAAVELGRLGGLKGGPARAMALSPKRRRDIAKKANKAKQSKNAKKTS